MKKKGRFIFLTLLFTATVLPIFAEKNMETERNALLKLDKSLSVTVGKEGILTGFLPYLTEESALFPDNGHPIMGKKACEAHIKKGIKQIKPTWKPLMAQVSNAGDLGFTHGSFKVPDPSDGKKNIELYYETVWYKPKDKWRILVSQGLLMMEGLNEPAIAEKYRTDIDKVDNVTVQLMNTELAFSAHAKAHGIGSAFYEFIADNGRVIRNRRPPATKERYAEMKKNAATSKSKGPLLQWQPFFSRVSSSHDIGVNFGPYVFTSTDKQGKSRESYGYFVTVWQRQADQKWKFLIDGGNSSPKVELKKELQNRVPSL